MIRFGSALGLGFLTVLLAPVALAWTVTKNSLRSQTGQSPSNAWQAVLLDRADDGHGILLENGGRLTYSSHDGAGEPIVPPIRGRIEFDLFSHSGGEGFFAAFDSGNVVIFSGEPDTRLRVQLRLIDGTMLELASAPDVIEPRKWTHIAVVYDLLLPADQATLCIDGTPVATGSTTATRLVPASPTLTWGMYAWGGGSWNGVYDNLTISHL